MRKGTVRDMKKNVLLRGLFGIPTGIAIGYVITVMMSAFWGDGSYYPCVPAFVDAMGSEIRAVVVQTVLCGLVGSVTAVICLCGAAAAACESAHHQRAGYQCSE